MPDLSHRTWCMCKRCGVLQVGALRTIEVGEGCHTVDGRRLENGSSLFLSNESSWLMCTGLVEFDRTICVGGPCAIRGTERLRRLRRLRRRKQVPTRRASLVPLAAS